MGNAIYLDDRPYVGKNGTAAEVGHMPEALSDRECSCGNKGCIEMYCCGKTLERLMQRHFSDTDISDLFIKYRDTEVFRDFVRCMAVPVATEINILDPEAVFLGGGIVQMQEFPREQLIEHILANTRKPYSAENIKICFSKQSPEYWNVGAAVMGFAQSEK